MTRNASQPGDAMKRTTKTLRPLLKPIKRKKNQGMNWTRWREELLARDGMSCMYCGAECIRRHPQKRPTLDHLIPLQRSRSTNDPINLVVSCLSCNSARQERPLRPWLQSAFGVRQGLVILARIHDHRTRDIRQYRD